MKIKAPWPRFMQCNDPYCWDHCLMGFAFFGLPLLYILYETLLKDRLF